MTMRALRDGVAESNEGIAGVGRRRRGPRVERNVVGGRFAGLIPEIGLLVPLGRELPGEHLLVEHVIAGRLAGQAVR